MYDGGMDEWMGGVYEGAPCRKGVGGSNQAVPSNRDGVVGDVGSLFLRSFVEFSIVACSAWPLRLG